MNEPGTGIKERLRGGEVLVGTFVNLGSALSVEVCCIAGLDWLVIDLEHGGGHEADLTGQLLAAAAHRTPALVRVETASRPRVGRALDLGSAGIMFPRIETVDEAMKAIAHTRYGGDRGVATYNRAARFGTDPAIIDEADDRVLGVVQVESPLAVGQAGEIAKVDGVDVLFVGPGDLSHAMGRFGKLDDPEFRDAIRTVVDSAGAAGKAAGILVAGPDDVPRAIEDGFRMIGVGSDSTLLMRAARAASSARDART